MNKEELIDLISEDISIVCIASCPICNLEFDAEDKEDTYEILEHIKTEHDEQELRSYLKNE